VSVFDPPAPFVLRDGDRERSAVAVCSMTNDDGLRVMYVRAGIQWRSESGDWLWKKGAGVTIPLRKLGELAAWLVDAARAIPRPEPSEERSKGWTR